MVIALPASKEPRQVILASHWETAVDVGRGITLAALVVAVIGLIWACAAPERIGRLRRSLAAGRKR